LAQILGQPYECQVQDAQLVATAVWLLWILCTGASEPNRATLRGVPQASHLLTELTQANVGEEVVTRARELLKQLAAPATAPPGVGRDRPDPDTMPAGLTKVQQIHWKVKLGLDRIVALHYCPSTSHRSR
jgi:hypothetical protein